MPFSIRQSSRLRALLILVVATVFAGCSVNPVTGKQEIVFVSEADEIRMGEQAYLPSQQSQGGVYDVDPALTAYVERVGRKLVAVSDRDLPYEFVVLNNSVPNAWAMPGGKMAINRGLLVELENEAELAAVLGHEIVHAAARHSAQQMTRGTFSQVLVAATAIAVGDSDYGALATGSEAVGPQRNQGPREVVQPGERERGGEGQLRGRHREVAKGGPGVFSAPDRLRRRQLPAQYTRGDI